MTALQYAMFDTPRATAAREREDSVIREAAAILYGRICQGDVLSSPEATRQFLQLRLAGLEHEVFGVLLLTNRHRVIGFHEMFRGTIDGASVHPREVVKLALMHNAAAIIMVHNHPSGDPTPSRADETITRRLKDALALVDVRVLDHIIVTAGETLSLAERGLV